MTMTLQAFKDQVLPLLQEKHRRGPELAKAVADFTAATPLVDEQGQPVALDVQPLAAEGEVDRAAGDLSEGRLDRLVRQSLDRLSKAHPAPSAFASGTAFAASVASGGTERDGYAAAGFASFGEFALAVHKASAQGGVADRRLLTKAPTTYAHEGAGEAGGFLVPQAWADRLWEVVLGEESLLSRTNQIPTSRNSLALPVSESTPWGSGGVQAYWSDEASAITQSRPKFEYRNLRLHKLAALVPASDELLEDAPALDAFIAREAARAIRYKADDALINGDGMGKPLGILSSDALVTVAKEANQTADTVVAGNIVKMYARMPASSLSGAVWLINQDVLPQFLSLTLGNQPVYLPPSGLAGAPFGTLLGRPVVLSQHAQTLGDLGDILFVDLRQYLTLTRRSGLHSAASIHLWFDHDVTAFRFTFRLAGQPWLAGAITPDHSSAALSPFVALAERA